MRDSTNGLNRGPDRPDAGKPPSCIVASGPQVGSPVESADGALHILTLKADEYGRCVATYLWAGLAHVSTFDWNEPYNDDVEIVGGDDWPDSADEFWSDVRDCVGEWLNGSEGERRQLNAGIAAEYVASKAVA